LSNPAERGSRPAWPAVPPSAEPKPPWGAAADRACGWGRNGAATGAAVWRRGAAAAGAGILMVGEVARAGRQIDADGPFFGVTSPLRLAWAGRRPVDGAEIFSAIMIVRIELGSSAEVSMLIHHTRRRGNSDG